MIPTFRPTRIAALASVLAMALTPPGALAQASTCPPPAISGITPSSVPAAGNIPITITGSNFTAYGSPKVTIGLRDVPVTLATNTMLVVTAPPMDDDAMPTVRIRAGKFKPAKLPLDRISYSPPLVDGAPPALVSRGGGVHLTVTGSNFRCSAPQAYLHNPGTGATYPARIVSADDTTVVVSTNDCDDTDDDLELRLRLGHEGIVHRDLAARNILLSGSRVVSVTPASVPASGGSTITIFGSGFDDGSGLAPRAQVCVDGRCADVRVASFTNTQVVGVAPPALVVPSNAQGRVVVTTGDVAGSSCAIDYDSTPIIRGSRSSSLPASGGYALTVRGDNFGPNMLMSCDDGSGAPVIVPATRIGPGAIVGIVVASAAATMNVSLVQDGHTSAPLALPVLAPPAISNAFAPANALGGDLVTITGSNFGPAAALHDVQVSVQQGATITPAGPVRWLAPNTLGARLPAGVAGSADLLVSVNGVGTTRPDAFTYGGTGSGTAPLLSGQFPTTVARGGGTVLTLSGTNFGATPSVRFGTQVLTPNPRGNTFAVIVTPALEDLVESVPIEVLANGKQSNPLYTPPATETTNPLAGSEAPSWGGGSTITITGGNFVAQSRVLVESSGGTSVLVTPASVTPSQLTFVAPEMPGGTSVTARVVNGGASSNAQPVAYAGPIITGISSETMSAAGGTTITITGSGFGAVAGKGFFETGDKPTQDQWADDHIVVTTSPRAPGCPPQRPFRIQTAAGDVSNATTIAFLAPVVDGLDTPATSALGGIPLTIRGSDFGPDAHVVWADGLPGPDITVTNRSATSFAILLGGSSSGSRLMSLDPDSQSPSVPFALELLSPPAAAGVTPAVGPVTGGNVVTVTGANFGPPGARREVRFAGADDCPFDVLDESSSFLVCQLPPVASAGLRDLVVEVEGVADTLHDAYEYSSTVGVDEGPSTPRALALAPLRSPFASEATLRLSLPQAGRWQLVLHDVRGAQVRRFEGEAAAGAFDLRWDGRAGDGHVVAPGVYFARLAANGVTRDARLVKLR